MTDDTILPKVSYSKDWARVDLSGEWRGTIQSQWKHQQADVPIAPIPATLDLRQGWEEVVFQLSTESMRSRSSPAIPYYDAATHELQFRYFFETSPTVASSRDNPPQKLGSAIARVDVAKPDRIEISYTNERGAGGDIVLERTTPQTGKRRRRRARSGQGQRAAA